MNFEQHRTIQENEKILLSHDTVHPHGLLRVYGWKIFHAERISWDFEIEDTRDLDFLNLQAEADVGSSISDDFKSKIEIYDVLLTRLLGLILQNLSALPNQSIIHNMMTVV